MSPEPTVQTEDSRLERIEADVERLRRERERERAAEYERSKGPQFFPTLTAWQQAEIARQNVELVEKRRRAEEERRAHERQGQLDAPFQAKKDAAIAHHKRVLDSARQRAKDAEDEAARAWAEHLALCNRPLRDERGNVLEEWR